MLRIDCYNLSRCAKERTVILSIAKPRFHERKHMVVNKIITEKELNYIETLYIYANLESFVLEKYTSKDFLMPDVSFDELQDIYDHDKYRLMLGYVHDTIISKAEYLGNSKGRDWYKLDNYRMGIMDYEKAKKSNQFNVEIQYTQKHLFSIDPNLKGLDLPFDGELSQYHIKRIDITQIVKTEKDYLSDFGFISPYRTMDRLSKGSKTETVYLGHRRNGSVFRMYDKTVELKTDNKDHPIDYGKIELLGGYFGDIENLYTFELELHRKYLKPAFGIDTLDDLEKVYKAYHEIVGKIKIYKDNDENKKHVRLKHYERIKEAFCFTEYKEFKRLNTREKKGYSEEYLVNKISKMMVRYEDSKKHPMRHSEKISLVDKIVSSIFIDNDVSIELFDSEIEQDRKLFYKKVDSSRDCDSALLSESYNAFKRVEYNPNPFI